MVEVRVGQVWEHCDKRKDGERFTIDSIKGNYARYWLNKGSKHRFVSIRLDRMRPTATGYRLVAERPQNTEAPTDSMVAKTK